MKLYALALFSLFVIDLDQQGCSTTDADGDDWTVQQGDCDDTDATSYPEAPELCDGRDNDCDGTIDDGVLGLDATCAAPSCKQILSMDPTSGSGPYYVDPSGSESAYSVYCDMTTYGGGWTQVTDLTEGDVDALRGRTARKMLKCSDEGSAYLVSPTWTSEWHWASSAPTQLGGTWIVNGTEAECGTDTEYDTASCSSWWGFKCSNGSGGTNKLYPGVLDSPSSEYCADSTSAHTNSSFSICGSNNYQSYRVFVRSED